MAERLNAELDILKKKEYFDDNVRNNNFYTLSDTTGHKRPFCLRKSVVLTSTGT